LWQPGTQVSGLGFRVSRSNGVPVHYELTVRPCPLETVVGARSTGVGAGGGASARSGCGRFVAECGPAAGPCTSSHVQLILIVYSYYQCNSVPERGGCIDCVRVRWYEQTARVSARPYPCATARVARATAGLGAGRTVVGWTEVGRTGVDSTGIARAEGLTCGTVSSW
jgi:hypothetical protein